MKRTDRVLVGVLLLCMAVWGAVISLPFAVWISFVSVLIGAAVTAFFSWHYYQRASNYLKDEAERLRSLTNLIIRAMHNAGLAEVRWNEHGEPDGLKINLSGVAGARGSASAQPTVDREEASEESH